jgi:hypothetical protein
MNDQRSMQEALFFRHVAGTLNFERLAVRVRQTIQKGGTGRAAKTSPGVLGSI